MLPSWRGGGVVVGEGNSLSPSPSKPVVRCFSKQVLRKLVGGNLCYFKISSQQLNGSSFPLTTVNKWPHRRWDHCEILDLDQVLEAMISKNVSRRLDMVMSASVKECQHRRHCRSVDSLVVSDLTRAVISRVVWGHLRDPPTLIHRFSNKLWSHTSFDTFFAEQFMSTYVL